MLFVVGDGAAKSVATGLVALVAITFLVAAASKLNSIDQLADMFSVSKLFSKTLSSWAAYSLVCLEFLVVLGLVFTRTRLMGLLLAATLSGVFVAFSVWRIIADIEAPCSCFGPLFTMTPYRSGGIAALLFLASLFSVRYLPEPRASTSHNLVQE